MNPFFPFAPMAQSSAGLSPAVTALPWRVLLPVKTDWPGLMPGLFQDFVGLQLSFFNIMVGL